MAIPTIAAVDPASGLFRGGEIIAITGTGFAPIILVTFGSRVSPETLGVTTDGTLAWVRAPSGSGASDVSIQNLDSAGDPIVGELVTAAAAYLFELPDLTETSELQRITRALIQRLKESLPASAVGPDSIAIDYDDDPGDGIRELKAAEVPGLSLAGPRMLKNMIYRRPDRRYEEIEGTGGNQHIVRGPSLTYDLLFSLTAAARSKAQLFNLVSIAAAALHADGKLSMLRREEAPEEGEIGWLLNLGAIRFSAPADGVHVASVDLRVVGFNIAEGFELSRSRVVETVEPSVSTK